MFVFSSILCSTFSQVKYSRLKGCPKAFRFKVGKAPCEVSTSVNNLGIVLQTRLKRTGLIMMTYGGCIVGGGGVAAMLQAWYSATWYIICDTHYVSSMGADTR